MAEDPAQLTNAGRIMLGILALLAADRDERVEGSTPRRTEVILDDAGFSPREISQLLGKELEAVRSTVRRSKPRPKKKAA